MDDRVSAGELRLAGIAIPDDIPGCATVPRESMQIRTKTQPQISASGVFSIDFEVSFLEPFRWHSVDLTISRDGEVTTRPQSRQKG